MKICLSSGHGAKISGANDLIKEHEEAVKVVNKTAEFLRAMGVEVETFEDKTSTSQDQNLRTIVNWHNSRTRDLDCSIHFNSSGATTSKPIGTECWFYTTNPRTEKLAQTIAAETAGASGLIDRGEKPSSGLYFLLHTTEDSVLHETCFVNSQADVNDCYKPHFDSLCEALAGALAGKEVDVIPPEPPESELFYVKGKASTFGGPADSGVSPSEGLAFIYPDDNGEPDEMHRFLFLPEQPEGTTGLARRLNAEQVFYAAARWDYNDTPKAMLANPNTQGLMRANGREFYFWPADWGPHAENTDKDIDMSPALMRALGMQSGDVAELIYPAP